MIPSVPKYANIKTQSVVENPSGSSTIRYVRFEVFLITDYLRYSVVAANGTPDSCGVQTVSLYVTED
jgi:hypothetical protein